MTTRGDAAMEGERRGRHGDEPVRGDAPAPELRIRPMTFDDLPDVLEIERASFTVPWTPATFRSLLVRPDAHLHVGLVDGRIVGYTAIWIVLDQAELGDLAVGAQWRGRGVGRQLLEHAFEVVESHGVTDLFLEVRVSNRAARQLYERHGFVQVGRRADYYSRPREDALVLRRGIGGGAADPGSG